MKLETANFNLMPMVGTSPDFSLDLQNSSTFEKSLTSAVNNFSLVHAAKESINLVKKVFGASQIGKWLNAEPAEKNFIFETFQNQVKALEPVAPQTNVSQGFKI